MICRISIGWSFCLRLCWSKASHAADRLRRSTVKIKNPHTIKIEEEQWLNYPYPKSKQNNSLGLHAWLEDILCPLKVTCQTGFKTPTGALFIQLWSWRAVFINKVKFGSFLAVKYLLCHWILWKYYTNYYISKNYIFQVLCSYRQANI